MRVPPIEAVRSTASVVDQRLPGWMINAIAYTHHDAPPEHVRGWPAVG